MYICLGTLFADYEYLRNLDLLEKFEKIHMVDTFCMSHNLLTAGELEKIHSFRHSLKYLIFDNNKLDSLFFVKKLNNLKRLNVQDNINIESIEPLKNLTGLIFLNCSGNRIQDLTALRNLEALISLFCNFNRIKSLRGLEHLNALKVLEFLGNNVNSFKGLPQNVPRVS